MYDVWYCIYVESNGKWQYSKTDIEQNSKDDGIAYTATVHNLKPNKSYNFRVRGLTNKCGGEYAFTERVTTERCAPPKPSIPKLAKHGKDLWLSIALPDIEDCGEEITGVNLMLCSSKLKVLKTETFEMAHTEEDKTFNITDLVCHETCWVAVSFNNTAGVSQCSEYEGITTQGMPPGLPENLRASEVNAKEINLQWKPSNRNLATKHEIWYTLDNDPQEWTCSNTDIVQINTENSVSYTATVNNLSPNSVYKFRVRGLNSGCEGEYAYSDPIRTDPSVPDKPAKPEQVFVNPVQPSQATMVLKLLSEDETNGYPVDKIIIQNNHETTDWATLKSIEDISLNPKQEYQQINFELPSLDDDRFNNHEVFDGHKFRVIMCNCVGSSEPSEAIILPLTNLFPGVPTDFIAEPGSYTLSLSWRRPRFNTALVDAYIAYSITMDQCAPGIGYRTHNIDAAQNEYTITGLASNTAYKVKIAAVYNSNYSPFEELVATTQQEQPGPPTELRHVAAGITKIKVRWRPPSEHPEEMLYYKVERSRRERGPFTEVRRTVGCSTVISGLQPRTGYFIKVTSEGRNRLRRPGASESIYVMTTVRETGFVAKILGLAGYQRPSPDEIIYESDEEFRP